MPASPFVFLLVEGGDERAICQWLVGSERWPTYCCWPAEGRDDLARVAAVAAISPNFEYARSIGVILDVESSIEGAKAIAEKTFQAFRLSLPEHASISTAGGRHGVFYSPSGASSGSIETLCRSSAANKEVAACVDALEACVSDASLSPAVASKRWVEAYLACAGDPNLRLHQSLSNGIFTQDAFASLKAFLLAL